MMADIIYKSIYEKLIQLIPSLFDLKMDSTQQSTVGEMMDLNLDIVDKGEDFIVIALYHYDKINGEMVADPDIEIKAYRWGMAEVLTYQDIYSHERVYLIESEEGRELKQEMNQLLNRWLTTYLQQGHQFV